MAPTIYEKNISRPKQCSLWPGMRVDLHPVLVDLHNQPEVRHGWWLTVMLIQGRTLTLRIAATTIITFNTHTQKLWHYLWCQHQRSMSFNTSSAYLNSLVGGQHLWMLYSKKKKKTLHLTISSHCCIAFYTSSWIVYFSSNCTYYENELKSQIGLKL